MKLEKRILAKLPEVYAINSIIIDDKIHFLAGSEAKGGQILLLSPPDFKPSIVSDNRGGHMSIVPLPDKQKEFLAIEGFFPVFKSESAGIIHAHSAEDITQPWTINRVIDIPFIHRFEIVNVNNQSHIIAAALCQSKVHEDDWSKPGAVYIAPIPNDIKDQWPLTCILENITKNHGMYCANINEIEHVFITGQEGIFQIQATDNWPTTQISDIPTSDITIADIDNDGIYEVVTIEPFHGNRLVVYKLNQNTLTQLYQTEMNFAHVAWIGTFNGGPTIIAANRAGEKDLVMITPKNGDFTKQQLDTGIGPTQIVIAKINNKDVILSANHAAGNIAIYSPA